MQQTLEHKAREKGLHRTFFLSLVAQTLSLFFFCAVVEALGMFGIATYFKMLGVTSIPEELLVNFQTLIPNLQHYLPT